MKDRITFRMLICAPAVVAFAIALILTGNLAGDLHLLVFHSAPRSGVPGAAHVCPVHGATHSNARVVETGQTHRDPSLCPVCTVGGLAPGQSVAPRSDGVLLSFAAALVFPSHGEPAAFLYSSAARSRAPPIS